jgi:hypothetical protein
VVESVKVRGMFQASQEVKDLLQKSGKIN